MKAMKIKYTPGDSRLVTSFWMARNRLEEVRQFLARSGVTAHERAAGAYVELAIVALSEDEEKNGWSDE